MLAWNLLPLALMAGTALLVRSMQWGEWAYILIAAGVMLPTGWLFSILLWRRTRANGSVQSGGPAGEACEVGTSAPPRWWHLPIMVAGWLAWFAVFFAGAHVSQGRSLAGYPLTFVTGTGPMILAYVLLIPAFAGGAVRTMTLRCVACGHVRSVTTPAMRSPPAACPACSAAWRLPPEARRSTNVPVGRAVAIIAAVFALFGLMIGTSHLARRAPTEVLVRVLSEDPSSSIAAWGTLRERGITPEQSDRLAEALLDRQGRGWRLSQQASGWLNSRVGALPLTPETLGRHLEAMIGLTLRVPGVEPVGGTIDLPRREVTVEMAVDRYDPSLPALAPAIFIEGIWADDGWAGRRHTGLLALYSVRSEWVSYGRTERHIDLSVPATTFEFQTPGEHEIHAAVWLVLPSTLAGRHQAEHTEAEQSGVTPERPTVLWGEDGRPIIPDATHMERRVLTIRVRVP